MLYKKEGGRMVASAINQITKEAPVVHHLPRQPYFDSTNILNREALVINGPPGFNKKPEDSV